MAHPDFAQECLDAHNEYRGRHGAPPLKLNPELSKFSQAWADKLVNENVLQNNPESKYGENIYLSESRDPTHIVRGYEPVDSWYEEVDNHRFGVEPRDLESGHFTQVVWKNTTDLGVGVAIKNGNVVVVCNYYKPGNILGEFTKNVPLVGGFSIEINSSIKSKSKVMLQESSTYLEPSFVENFLRAHNKYRLKHGVPPLALDETLNKHAQEWANMLAEKDKLEIRAASPYGQNYYSVYSSNAHFKLKGHIPVDSWYDDKENYEFGKESFPLKGGKFTQLIWKNTKFLGVGFAKAEKSNIFVVADYDPPGNGVGEFAENVPDLIDEATLKALEIGIPVEEIVEDSSDELFVDKHESDGLYTPFQLEGLDVHNYYRRKHGVPPLSLNKHLCDFSKEWAEENLKLQMYYHRPRNEYGENIYTISSTDYNQIPSARDAVKAWYEEIEYYEFDNENVNWGTLHFTQLIWRGTKELGMDIATNKGNSYIVANYSPRGNVMKEFIANVPRPLEGPHSQKSTNEWT